jgi:hypothetical protein
MDSRGDRHEPEGQERSGRRREFPLSLVVEINIYLCAIHMIVGRRIDKR